MLPECRQQEQLFSVPKFEIISSDVVSFVDELRCFHDEFSDCFHRSETRDNVFRSMVNDDMGDTDGVLMFDESGFVKKGKDSAGVQRQYCGNIGKVENSQVGVYAAYASRHGYAFLDKRLFIPEAWFLEEHKERREKCNFPENLTFATKPQLAAEMLTEIHNQGTIPYKYIVADSIYGHSPDFIETAEKLDGKIYFVSIASDTKCWLKTPATTPKEYTYKDETHAKIVLRDTLGNRAMF